MPLHPPDGDYQRRTVIGPVTAKEPSHVSGRAQPLNWTEYS
jgi:hypothetical protein